MSELEHTDTTEDPYKIISSLYEEYVRPGSYPDLGVPYTFDQLVEVNPDVVAKYLSPIQIREVLFRENVVFEEKAKVIRDFREKLLEFGNAENRRAIEICRVAKYPQGKDAEGRALKALEDGLIDGAAFEEISAEALSSYHRRHSSEEDFDASFGIMAKLAEKKSELLEGLSDNSICIAGLRATGRQDGRDEAKELFGLTLERMPERTVNALVENLANVNQVYFYGRKEWRDSLIKNEKVAKIVEKTIISDVVRSPRSESAQEELLDAFERGLIDGAAFEEISAEALSSYHRRHSSEEDFDASFGIMAKLAEKKSELLEGLSDNSICIAGLRATGRQDGRDEAKALFNSILNWMPERTVNALVENLASVNQVYFYGRKKWRDSLIKNEKVAKIVEKTIISDVVRSPRSESAQEELLDAFERGLIDGAAFEEISAGVYSSCNRSRLSEEDFDAGLGFMAKLAEKESQLLEGLSDSSIRIAGMRATGRQDGRDGAKALFNSILNRMPESTVNALVEAPNHIKCVNQVYFHGEKEWRGSLIENKKAAEIVKEAIISDVAWNPRPEGTEKEVLDAFERGLIDGAVLEKMLVEARGLNHKGSKTDEDFDASLGIIANLSEEKPQLLDGLSEESRETIAMWANRMKEFPQARKLQCLIEKLGNKSSASEIDAAADWLANLGRRPDGNGKNNRSTKDPNDSLTRT